MCETHGGQWGCSAWCRAKRRLAETRRGSNGEIYSVDTAEMQSLAVIAPFARQSGETPSILRHSAASTCRICFTVILSSLAYYSHIYHCFEATGRVRIGVAACASRCNLDIEGVQEPHPVRIHPAGVRTCMNQRAAWIAQ